MKSLDISHYHGCILNFEGPHSLVGLSVPGIGKVPPPVAAPEDDGFCRRIIEAYRKALTRCHKADGIWGEIAHYHHSEFAQALEAGNLPVVRDTLNSMFNRSCCEGLGMGPAHWHDVQHLTGGYALDWHDRMVALAIAVGIIPRACPEQDFSFGQTLRTADSPRLFNALEDYLGCKFLFPQMGEAYGGLVGERIIPNSYLMHIYTAYRATTLMEKRGISCLEIGGGYGGLAHALLSLGAKRYTIIDLPIINAVQGYFLLKSSFGDRVRLYGESCMAIRIHENERGTATIDDRNGTLLQDPIRIFPAFALDPVQDGFEIAINQDSMPEMGKQTAIDYLQYIEKSAKRFLSVNQEGREMYVEHKHQWVYDLIRGHTSFKQIYRVPYWLRAGYVEEFYLAQVAKPRRIIVQE